MAFQDPVVVYIPASNLEAHFLQNLLIDSGVEALAVEDVSQVGTWIGGLVSQLHKPQVLIERADIEKAKTIIEQYEHRLSERRNPDANAALIEVVCEECGKQTLFPATLIGSVQNCPNCFAYVDVGDDASFDGWQETEGEEADGPMP